MPAIELPLLPSLLAACLVLVIGGFLAQRVPFLGRYSIPAPIIGGLIFLTGVVGWVLVEDVRMFPSDTTQPHGEAHH